MALSISTDAPVSAFYTIDISDMGFVSEDAADRFFKSMTDNLVRATVDYTTQKATLHLMLEYAPSSPSWTVTDWNNYLAGKTSKYQGAFDKFNE